MKIIIVLLTSLFFISCNNRKPETSWIISGEDTIEIKGNYSWLHLGSPCGGRGHNDFINNRFIFTFNNCYSYSPNKKVQRLHFLVDSLIEASPLKKDSFTIHFTKP